MFLMFTQLSCKSPGNNDLAFINEFHYKNTGDDVGQFIEIAHCGSILSGYGISLGTLLPSDITYQEFTPYPISISALPDENGFFYSVFAYSDIRDGPGYISLYYFGGLVDSLTYEDNRDLDNRLPDTVVFESESTPIGYSLQRINGTWVGPLPRRRAAVTVRHHYNLEI